MIRRTRHNVEDTPTAWSVGRAATEAEETESPRAADGVAGSAATTATVRKSDRVFRKQNTLALFSVPLLLVTLIGIANTQTLFATLGAWFPVTEMDGHPLVKCIDFIRETGTGFGLQSIHPVMKRLTRSNEKPLPFSRFEFVSAQ